MKRLALPRPAWIVLIYSGLALFFTWPLARYFTTHMPGNGIDDPALGWNLWWIKTRLVEQLNPDIFHVDWMFHPIQINLAFYTLTPLNGLLSIPLQLCFGLTVANNLVLLASFVLSGFGAFLLVEDILHQIGRWGDKETGRQGSAVHLVTLSPCQNQLLFCLIFTYIYFVFAQLATGSV